MIYVKLNYKATWLFYGPWKDVRVHYNCTRRDRVDGPILFKIGNEEEICVDEIFCQGDENLKDLVKNPEYTIVSGFEDGLYRSMAIKGCTAYLLTPEGKTLDRI